MKNIKLNQLNEIRHCRYQRIGRNEIKKNGDPDFPLHEVPEKDCLAKDSQWPYATGHHELNLPLCGLSQGSRI